MSVCGCHPRDFLAGRCVHQWKDRATELEQRVVALEQELAIKWAKVIGINYSPQGNEAAK